MRMRFNNPDLDDDADSAEITVETVRQAHKRMVPDPSGNLMSSKPAIDAFGTGEQLPIFDLDFECELVPSRTSGHYHLYVNKYVAPCKLRAVIAAMVDAGLQGQGNLAQFDADGMQLARFKAVSA